MKEQWKAIPEFPGYEVSDQGRVRSYHRRRPGVFPIEWYISDTPARILKPSRTKYGYASVQLCRNGETTVRRVAPLVLEAFVGPRPEGLEVCHGDSNPTNDALDNLRYDTRQGNLEDRKQVTNEMVRKIRRWRAVGASYMELANAFGLSYPYVQRICTGGVHKDKDGPITTCRLTDDEVRAIRTMRKEGETYRKIGEEFGLTESGAWRIANRQRYADVPDEPEAHEARAGAAQQTAEAGEQRKGEGNDQ